MTLRIPLAKPEVTDADRDAVMEVLRTPYLSTGPKVAEFERAIRDYTGAKHGVAVNSGTSALQIAIRTLGIEPGAEVVLPSFTFSALLNVILLEGLCPKFMDIDERTYNCTAEAMLAAVSDETRLIIAVHTFGFPVDVSAVVQGLSRQSRKRKVYVIEDACEGLGADVHGRKVGTLGDAGLFAFYPNKQITTGEGGMLVTSNESIARKAAQLRNQGRDPALGWNSHAEIGFSYRISDINCALGISQMARIEDVIARRQKIAEAYNRELAEIAEITRPPLTSEIGRISWFVYPVQLADEFEVADRDRVCESMLHQGIATGRYFAPLHKQPVLDSFLNETECWRRTPKASTTKDTKVHKGRQRDELRSIHGDRVSKSLKSTYASGAQRRNNVAAADPAAQRRSINSPAPFGLAQGRHECREGGHREDGVRFSGRPELLDDQSLPNTDFVAERVIQLPFFNVLTEANIQEVCKALKQAIQDVRRNT